jgi:hypothetical protein
MAQQQLEYVDKAQAYINSHVKKVQATKLLCHPFQAPDSPSIHRRRRETKPRASDQRTAQEESSERNELCGLYTYKLCSVDC